jgi:anti-anti-sigma regulatory factor
MATSAAGLPPAGNTRAVPRPAARVGTEEFHSAALPVPQEAAILYSANLPEAAAALLKQEIKDPVGRNNKQAWLMLFDLHQAAENRAEFDSLSMLFTVKFEQSPPAWSDTPEGSTDPRRQQSRERKDFFAMKPSASGEIAAEIDRFVAFAESQGTVRLDLGKVTALSPEEATLLATALRKLRRKQLPMWFNAVEGFEKILRDAMNERASEGAKPYWELLFEMLILDGRMSDFEDLALEFAVAFEMSPPNWEPYVNSVAQAVKAAPPSPAVSSAASVEPAAGYSMKGVLSAASANQMAELNAYAASQTEVVVDMSRLLRIDFAYTSAFFDAVKASQLAGKRVILANLNELNAALLEALGVNRYAILVRRKST